MTITETWIFEQTGSFVASLNGRYREWVSDIFLTYIIAQRLYDSRTDLIDKIGAERYNESHDLSGLAYNVSCPIFELALEHHCGAGGNGHAVAQQFHRWIANVLKQTNESISKKGTE